MINSANEHSKRHPSLADGLLLLSGVVVVGICFYLFFTTYPGKYENVTTSHVSPTDMLIKNYSIRYPVFRAEKVDMMIRNEVQHYVNEYLQKLGSRRNDPGNFLSVDYTILHYDDHTATVMYHQKEALFNQVPTTTRTIITYDLKDQRMLAAKDLFSDTKAAGALIGRIIHDYFNHNYPEMVASAPLDWLERFDISTVQDFILDDDQVIVYFNPHAVASSDGRVSIGIKKELLKPVLKTNYAAARPNNIQTEPIGVTYVISVMPPRAVQIDPNGKLLALTFDDGPGSLTPKLLDTLKIYGAHATFFVIGRQVPTHAETVRRTVEEGNEVGNHTWSHPNLTRVSQSQLDLQVQDTQRAIRQATGGYTPRLVRPPEGAVNGAVQSFFSRLGLQTELWNIDTNDWLYRNAETIYGQIMNGAADGRVILLHDIHQTSVDAAIRAIPELVAQGYQLVTVSQLRQYR